MQDPSGRPTRTEATVRAYLQRYDELKRRASRAGGLVEPGPLEIAEYAKSIACELAAATWRQYRAALRYGFEAELPSQEHAKALTLLDAIRREPGSRPSELRTSAQKKKTTNADEIEVLFSAIARSTVELAAPLLAILQATAIVGCRPCEWWGGDIRIEGGVTVSIRNAKTTNGRGAGQKRDLTWKKLPDTVLAAITATIERANSFSSREAWTIETNRLQRLLHDISRDEWPKAKRHFSIYSFRHRFSALAKSEFAAEIVAACMGHGSDATAARNYARAGSKNVKMDFETEAGLPTPESGPVRATLEKRLQSLTKRRNQSAEIDKRLSRAEKPSAYVEIFKIKPAVSSVGADIDDFPVPNKSLQSGPDPAAEKFQVGYLAEQARIWDELLAPYTREEGQPAPTRTPSLD